MAALFASGRVVDLILLFLALEGLVLIGWHMRTGRGIAPAEVLGLLLSGAFLLLALRAALTDAPWQVVGVLLALSGLAQAYDLIRRWR